jgi:glycosyltransferase involved in cell wall biosynthesis
MKNSALKIKKIMWVVGFAPEKIGSYEELIFCLAEQAKRNNYEISFVFPGEPLANFKDRLLKLGGQVFVSPVKKRTDVKGILQLAKLINKERPTILHSNFDMANFNCYFATLFARVPIYVWHQHNLMGEKLGYIRNIFLRLLSIQVASIIAISEAVRNDLVLKGAIKQKIEKIYNGIETDKFNSISPAEINRIKEEFNIPLDAIVLISVGQARPEKGLIFLIKAFSRAIERCPNSILLLIGGKNGPCYDELLEEAIKLKLKDKIFFTGMRNDVARILQAADIVVVPSLLEGLSYSIIEGMAASKPIIASRVGGIPEVVKEGETGMLVAPSDVKGLSDAIAYLTANLSVRVGMGEAGRKVAEEKFNIKRNVEQIFELYKQIARRKRIPNE